METLTPGVPPVSISVALLPVFAARALAPVPAPAPVPTPKATGRC